MSRYARLFVCFPSSSCGYAYATALVFILIAAPCQLYANPPFSPFTEIRMAADLEKPYTEFEFEGQTYALENLVGGHNSAVAAVCKTNPPVFDQETGTWRIPVTNNFVQLSGTHPLFGTVNLGSADEECEGYLEFINNPQNEEDLDFPVRSVFLIDAKIELPDFMGGLTFVSDGHVMVTADNLTSWPPPVGTEYVQAEQVQFLPEGGGFPVLTLMPDTTLITAVYEIEFIGGYKIYSQNVPRGDDPPSDQDINSGWTALPLDTDGTCMISGGVCSVDAECVPADQRNRCVVPIDTPTTGTVTCAGDEDVYLAHGLVFDSGFQTQFLSANSTRVECGPNLAEPDERPVRVRPSGPFDLGHKKRERP